MVGPAPTSPAARRYAKAAFRAAEENDSLAAFEGDLGAMNAVMEVEGMAPALADPRVDAKKRAEFLKRACPDLGDAARGLLEVLTLKRRLEILGQVLAASTSLMDVHHGRLKGTVETVAPLAADELHSLEAMFSNQTGKEVSLEQETNPSLLGGVRVTLAGTRWDASARGRLESLRNKLETVDIG